MRYTPLTLMFAVVIGLCSFGQTALAMYHPGIGRYMQRDPIGDISNRTLAAPPSMGNAFLPRDPMPSNSLELDAMQRAAEKTADRLGLEHAANPWLWQYADGMNLYQYIQSSPTKATDPSGLQPAGLPGKQVGLGLQLASAGATLIGNAQACNQCALTELTGNSDATWVAPPAIGPLPVYIRQVFIVWPYTTTVTWTPTCARRNCGELYALVFYKMPGKNGTSGFGYVKCR